jgi:hypothetical protein
VHPSLNVLDELIRTSLSFISGSLVGGVLSHWLSIHRQRTDLSVKLMESFLNQYTAIAEAKGLLGSEGEEATSILTPSEQNTVRKAGDWFELVAVLYLGGATRRKLLQSFGLVAEMRQFFKHATRHPQFKNSGEAWTNLQLLATNDRL